MTFPKDRQYFLPNPTTLPDAAFFNNEVPVPKPPKKQKGEKPNSSYRKTDPYIEKLLGLRKNNSQASKIWKPGDRAYLAVHRGDKKLGFISGIVGRSLPGGKIEFFLDRDSTEPLDVEVRLVVPKRSLKRSPEKPETIQKKFLKKIQN